MAAPNIRQVIDSIQKGTYNTVYLLTGDEAYFVDLILDALEKKVVSADDRDFNYSLFYGNDVNADIVINAAKQFPFMADKRLVILKEAQAMNRARTELEKFIPYVSRPNASSVFVITYVSDKTTVPASLEKAVSKAGGIVFKSKVPYDNELPGYIKDYCLRNRIGIDEKSVTLLCDYIGGPLSKLFGEINKLIHIKKDDGSARISPEDIERHIGISRDFNNRELVNAIRERDYPKCIRIVNYFRNNPKTNPGVVTSAVLFNFFTQLIIAHFLPVRTDTSLMEVLDRKNSYALRDLKTAMRNYPPVKAVNAIHHIREFDAKNKGVGSFQKEYDLMQELIFKIMT